MARHKDADWDLPEKNYSWTPVTAALLMDLRDELKRLNRLLHCDNFVGIPWTLKRIEAAVTPQRRRRVKK